MLTITFAGIELADGLNAGKQVVGGLKVNGTRAVDVVTLLRALQPSFYDRLTNSNGLSFTVVEQVLGQARAFDRMLSGRQNLPGAGALVIELTELGTVHRWKAARCGCPTRPVTTLGASVEITYELTAGTFTYSTSDDEDYAGDQVEGGTFPPEDDPAPEEEADDEMDGGSFLEEALAGHEVDGGTFA